VGIVIAQQKLNLRIRQVGADEVTDVLWVVFAMRIPHITHEDDALGWITRTGLIDEVL
jgi:hypothetical protein